MEKKGVVNCEYWEIEDIGVHANIKVVGREDDIIGLGFPVLLAQRIVDRHNESMGALNAKFKLLLTLETFD